MMKYKNIQAVVDSIPDEFKVSETDVTVLKREIIDDTKANLELLVKLPTVFEMEF